MLIDFYSHSLPFRENLVKISNVPARVAVRSIFYDALLAHANPVTVSVAQVQHLLSQPPFCPAAMRQAMQTLLVEWKNALFAPASGNDIDMPASATEDTTWDMAGPPDHDDDESESTDPPRRRQRASQLQPRGSSHSSSSSDDTSTSSSTVEMRVPISSGSDSSENVSIADDTIEAAAEPDSPWVDDDEDEEVSGPKNDLGIAPGQVSSSSFAQGSSPRADEHQRQETTAKPSLRFRWDKEQISFLNRLVAKHRASAPRDTIDWPRIYQALPLNITTHQTVKQVETCYYNNSYFDMTMSPKSKPRLPEQECWTRNQTSTPKPKPELLKRGRWTRNEEEAIRQGIAALGFGNWALIRHQYSAQLKDRTVDQISRKGSAMKCGFHSSLPAMPLPSGRRLYDDADSSTDDSTVAQPHRRLAGGLEDDSSSESGDESYTLSTQVEVPSLVSFHSENVSLINQPRSDCERGPEAPSRTDAAEGAAGPTNRRFRWTPKQIQLLKQLAVKDRSGWIDWNKVHENLPESLRNQQTVSQIKTVYFNHN
jgi:hypothetical protein